MEVKLEQLEKNKVRLEVEVEKEKVNAAINTAVRSLARRVNIPGFRRGRVPRPVLELKLGKEAIYDEALELLLPEAYSQAVAEQGLDPIDKPLVEEVKIEEDQPLVFTATVEVMPQVQLGEYTGLPVNKQKVEITEEQVDAVLKDLQERHATFSTSEEPAAEGDLIMADFRGTVDGESFEGSQAENMPLVVGAPGFFPGLSEGLAGAKKGETKEVKLTLPADFRVSEVAGKEALFTVTVKEVHKKSLAPLDDEFAKDVSEFGTLEELRNAIRQNLSEAAERRIRELMEAQVIRRALEKTEIEVPDVLVARRAHTLLHNFEHELAHRGLSLDKYCEIRETTPEKVEEEFKPAASNQVKTELLLDAIAKAENLTVTPEKVTETLERMAQGQKNPEKRIKEWTEDGTKDMVERSLLREAAVAFLLDKADITETAAGESEEEEAQSSEDASQGD
ncbi:MAG: trigger factor [Firmicutes bacterium]|nr:trigger factor [Bacillota bacterium]